MINSKFFLSSEGSEYQSRDAFIEDFKTLSTQRFGRCLTVDRDKKGILRDIHFLEYFWESIRLLILGQNQTRSLLVGLNVIQRIELGLSQGWFKQEDVSSIHSLARRAGILGEKSKPEVNQYISEISKEILMDLPHSQEGYIKALTQFKANDLINENISDKDLNCIAIQKEPTPDDAEPLEVDPPLTLQEKKHPPKAALKWKTLFLLSLSIIYIGQRIFSNYLYGIKSPFEDYKNELDSNAEGLPNDALIIRNTSLDNKYCFFDSINGGENQGFDLGFDPLLNHNVANNPLQDVDNLNQKSYALTVFDTKEGEKVVSANNCSIVEEKMDSKLDAKYQPQPRDTSGEFLIKFRILTAAVILIHSVVLPWLREKIEERRV